VAAGDRFHVAQADGTQLVIVATDDGIPVRQADGTVIYLGVNP